MTVVAAVAITASVIYLIVKKSAPEFAIIAEICAVVLVILFVYPYICDIVDFCSELETDNSYLKLLLRITGVAVITQFSADLCKDSGMCALSSKVEFAGKTVMLVMSLPIIEALFEFATGLINER
ncbi:MAG: hypothetical protein IKV76_09430 [Clostridia bacterium]|nr:hypothetical protein [Clostridia bacterium]